MKVLAVLSLVLAVAASYPIVETMTISELTNALNSENNPTLQPFFQEAIDEIMKNLFNGQDNFSQKVFLSPSGKATWTIEELTNELKVIEEPTTSNDYRMAVHQAHGIYRQKLESGIIQEDIQVVIPAMDISKWTLADLETAQKNDKTNAELLLRVEKALVEITKTLQNTTGMVSPVGVLPHEPYF